MKCENGWINKAIFIESFSYLRRWSIVIYVNGEKELVELQLAIGICPVQVVGSVPDYIPHLNLCPIQYRSWFHGPGSSSTQISKQ